MGYGCNLVLVYSLADFFSMQSQFINQHVTASIIQRNAPTNVWWWEFNIVQRACSRVMFGGWLAKTETLVLNEQLRYQHDR
jgi:hypothetical protein